MAPLKGVTDSDRRIRCLRLDYELLNTISKRLGSHPWFQGGGVNLVLISWLHRLMVDTGKVPKDSIPTWVWADPSCGQLRVLIYSSEFEPCHEGAPAPDLPLLLERDAFEEALQRDCPAFLKKAVCVGCQRRKTHLIVEGHKPGCRFETKQDRLDRGAGPTDHSGHGRGEPDSGPDYSDCPCRGSALESECSVAGCGFCGRARKVEGGG